MTPAAKFILVLIYVLLALQISIVQSSAENNLKKQTDNEHFTVSITSKLDPITINTMHAWIIKVEDKNKHAVLDANINVDGGMPEHDHGLPTRPQITENLGNGCYLLEGIKFHMSGWWTITLSISDKNVHDSVTFDLNL